MQGQPPAVSFCRHSVQDVYKRQEYYDGYSTVVQDEEGMKFLQSVQKKASELNIEDYFVDEAYYINVFYIKQDNSQVYRSYTPVSYTHL